VEVQDLAKTSQSLAGMASELSTYPIKCCGCVNRELTFSKKGDGMFEDRRSKKVILLAHCVLNQNAKIDACAHYPGAIKEVTDSLLEREVGFIQMPCPELFCLGLDRGAHINNKGTVETEDTRVAQCMDKRLPRKICKAFVDSLIYQVEEYRKHGFCIVGLVGINGSPTCGVDTTWSEGQEQKGHGIFIGMLNKALEEKSVHINTVGIKAKEPKQAIAAIERLFNKGL
jgi:predicted secreted protein